MDAAIRTYQTRGRLEAEDTDILLRCADHLSHIKHALFADISAGKNPNDLKSCYLTRYGITARHFNAIRVTVEGKIASIKERRKGLIVELEDRIKSIEAKITRCKKPMIVHQKKR